MLGPVAGAVLVARWGYEVAYTIDAVLFLAALWALLRLPSLRPGTVAYATVPGGGPARDVVAPDVVADASGAVHAVVLSGRSVRSSGPAMVSARMAAKRCHRLLMFRYSPDSGRWTAVFTKEG